MTLSGRGDVTEPDAHLSFITSLLANHVSSPLQPGTAPDNHHIIALIPMRNSPLPSVLTYIIGINSFVLHSLLN